MTAKSDPIVDIKGLTVDYMMYGGFFSRKKQTLRVLNNIDLQIFAGETRGIVGESGCGKTTLANSITRLVRPTSGEVIYQGIDILKLAKSELRSVRRNIQLVFQDPFSSLDPRMNIFESVAEPLRTHTDMRINALEKRVEEVLENVGLSSEFVKRYPHQLSGGQAHRSVIARALALKPSFIILDEPTSALDVSVQAQIINLLARLQREHNLTYMFISHDLSLVQHISNRIGVMYLGEIVELCSNEDMFEAAQHPYTQALLSATPVPDPKERRQRIVLEGNVPSPSNPPPGCRFHPRCPCAMDMCRHEKPEEFMVEKDHMVACHLFGTD